MEPFVLQPHAGEMRYVGRGEARENTRMFPCYFHLCVAKGTRATDGWSVVSSLKCTSCTEDLGPNRHMVDAWINDTRERSTRKISQTKEGIAKTADKHCFWQAQIGFVFSQPVDFNAGDLPGKQMHPVLKLGDSIAKLLQGKNGVWVVPEDSQRADPGTFSRPWCSGYLLRVPALVAESPLKLVTPFAFCQKLKVEPSAREDPSRQETALAVVAASSSGRFASRQDYYDRGANWGDPRSERSPLQDIARHFVCRHGLCHATFFRNRNNFVLLCPNLGPRFFQIWWDSPTCAWTRIFAKSFDQSRPFFDALQKNFPQPPAARFLGAPILE